MYSRPGCDPGATCGKNEADTLQGLNNATEFGRLVYVLALNIQLLRSCENIAMSPGFTRGYAH